MLTDKPGDKIVLLLVSRKKELIFSFKGGIIMTAVLTSLNTAFLAISRLRFKAGFH